jgi:diaminohydroxyphosphoribosylaminopyrimidine deaminase/5-amino-6-(5-phosphoribosylamino)uracil reductase
LEDEAREQNEVFFKFIPSGLPFVTLKIAQTVDARIADEAGHSHWITGEESRRFTHQLRHFHDAVMVGGHTAVVDNPQLTVRHVEGNNPLRIILAGREQLPPQIKLFCNNDDDRTIIAVSAQKAERSGLPGNVRIWEIDSYEDGHINIAKLLLRAGREKISSILVEGGSRLFSEFIRRKFVDKIYVGIAPRIIGGGIPAFQELGINTLEHSVEIVRHKHFVKGDDLWLCGYPCWR